jgi:hypothetical protein
MMALAALLLGSGCSSTSVFRSYPSQINPVIAKVRNNETLKEQLFVRQTQGKDKTLYLMERGRVSQLYRDAAGSRTNFEAAIAAIRVSDESARISASDAAAQSSAILLNDNTIPYKAAGYERVMLRYLQAVNYLQAGDLDGARVEIANADAEQRSAAERHAREVEKARKMAAEREAAGRSSPASRSTPQQGSAPPAADFGATMRSVNAALNDKYAGLDEVAGNVKNSFQNGSAYYLSGLIYESLKDDNNAYISYKQALELFPENKTLQNDVARIAMKDARADDLAELKSRFGLTDADVKGLVEPTGFGRVVVLYEDGFVTQKREIKLPIPVIGLETSGSGPRRIDTQGIAYIVFPVYEVQRSHPSPLSVAAGDLKGATMLVCDVNALAVKSLKENAPAMVVRLVARLVAKTAATKVAYDEAGPLGGLLSSALASVTESADLRSWLTLPQDIQVYRTSLAAGLHPLTLSAGGGSEHKLEIKVEAGRTTFVHVVGAGINLLATSSVF